MEGALGPDLHEGARSHGPRQLVLTLMHPSPAMRSEGWSCSLRKRPQNISAPATLQGPSMQISTRRFCEGTSEPSGAVLPVSGNSTASAARAAEISAEAAMSSGSIRATEMQGQGRASPDLWVGADQGCVQLGGTAIPRPDAADPPVFPPPANLDI